MSAEHGHHGPTPPPEITTPQGRQLFPDYMPPRIARMSPERRTELFGASDRSTRIDNPGAYGIPNSGSGHHPEQFRPERLASINSKKRELPKLKGINIDEVANTLMGMSDQGEEANERMLRRNPQVFLKLRAFATEQALKRHDGKIDRSLEDYLTAVHLADITQYDGKDASEDSAPAKIRAALLDPGDRYLTLSDEEMKPEHKEAIRRLKGTSVGRRVARTPHLINSGKDRRLHNKMRYRKHGRTDHGDGAMAATLSAEHYEHTLEAIGGDVNETWTKKKSGEPHEVDHGTSDRREVRRTIKKYSGYLDDDLETIELKTYGGRKRGIKRKGIVSYPLKAADDVKKRIAKEGKLEGKREALDRAIADKEARKEANRARRAAERAERRERRREMEPAEDEWAVEPPETPSTPATTEPTGRAPRYDVDEHGRVTRIDLFDDED